VWQRVEGGLAEPVNETMVGESAGGDYDSDAMILAARRFDKSTQMDVLKPLRAWMAALHMVRVSP